jgi:hypothetical protein
MTILFGLASNKDATVQAKPIPLYARTKHLDGRYPALPCDLGADQLSKRS